MPRPNPHRRQAMKFEITRSIGSDIVKIEDEATDMQDFFRRMCLLQSIPTCGPNGEPDIYLSHRVAQGKHHFYAVVCETAGMEFCFGVPKADSKSLYPKGWRRIQHKINRFPDQEEYAGEAEPHPAPTNTRPQTPAQATNTRAALRQVPDPQEYPANELMPMADLIALLARALPRIGVTSPGLEKAWVMKTLSQKSGKLVSQCNHAELVCLWEAANSTGNAAAA